MVARSLCAYKANLQTYRLRGRTRWFQEKQRKHLCQTLLSDSCFRFAI